MDFKIATDRLKERIRLADLAKETGVRPVSIRRARLDPEGPSYRSPPEEWREAAARLARERAEELLELAQELESELKEDGKEESGDADG